MVSEFIELRWSAGNNRVNHGIWFFWGFLVGVGRTRCAPTGFGGVGFFGVFWWGLGARDAPLRVLGGFFGGFLGVFWWGLGARGAPLRVLGGFFGGFLMGVGRTRCAPTGFGGIFWGFQEKYVGVNCDRL